MKAADPRGLSHTRDLAVSVTNVNEPPLISGISGEDTFTVAENHSGTLDTYTAYDPEGQTTLTWSLGGVDAGDFELSDMRELSFDPPPDYDIPADSGTNNIYNVTVQASDGTKTGKYAVTVTVENVPEAPVITRGPEKVNYPENRTDKRVASYAARDPENPSASLDWSLGGADPGAFEISTSGVVTFKNQPDYETKHEYAITVEATDAGGLTGRRPVTVTVEDVNEPADISFAATGGVTVNNNALSVDENYDGTLATFTASDPERKPGLTYQWSVLGTDRLDFAITAAGVLSFVNIPDHERPADSGGNNVYDITVTALDSDDKRGNIDITVTVEPVPEAPVITGDAEPSIEEDGTRLLGTYRARDPESATIAWLPLAGDDFDKFDFTSSNGRLAFKVAPDFEDATDFDRNNVYGVTLGVSAGGHTTTFDVEVTVTNKEEPGMLALPRTRPQVEADYTATLSDLDGVQSTTWTWERSTSRSGPWTAVSGAADSTTTSVYMPLVGDIGYYLRVTAVYTDGHGPNKSFVAVSNNSVRAKPVLNNPPAFTETSPTRSIAENAGANAAVGARVTATDPDSGDTVRYELDPESDLFTIDSSGQIRVKTQGSLDYDDRANRTHIVRVKASDSSNVFDTVQVTIEVTDVNEPPDAVADAPDSFDEDTEITIDVLANDSDPEDDPSALLLTVFNSGPNAPRNGTVTVNEPANPGDNRTITYEPKADYNGSDSFTYRVGDTGSPSLSRTAAVSVQIDAVNDAPTFASLRPQPAACPKARRLATTSARP